MRKRLIAVATSSIFLVAACGASDSQVVPTDLVGEYTQIRSGIPDVLMHATVDENSIQVDMTPRGEGSHIYWLGTFQTDGSKSDHLTLTTIADPNTAELIWTDKAKTKKFEYDNDHEELSFRYESDGIVTTVYLRKQKTVTVAPDDDSDVDIHVHVPSPKKSKTPRATTPRKVIPQPVKTQKTVKPATPPRVTTTKK